jgi:hypothetical protein
MNRIDVELKNNNWKRFLEKVSPVDNGIESRMVILGNRSKYTMEPATGNETDGR